MKTAIRRHLCSVGVATLALALTVMTMAGCGGSMGRAPSPSPTPILLPPSASTPAASRPLIMDPRASEVAQSPAPATSEQVPTPRPTQAETPPVSLMALGIRETVILRADAAEAAGVVAKVPGSRVFWAQGRDMSAAWLWVVYDAAGQHAWVAAGDVKLLGDAMSLTDVTYAAVAAAAPPGPASTHRITAAPAGAPTPQPAPTPSGKIAIQTSIGGDIYLVKADGTELRAVTTGIDPTLSPDGTRLAFVRWGTPDGVYLLDLRTGEERLLVSAQRPRSPTWSPDGTALVVSHRTGVATCLEAPFGCYSESQIRDMFHGKDCLDSAQGRACIADFAVRQIELTGLLLLNLTDGTRLDLPSQPQSQSPAWDPQGDEILFVGRSGLQQLSLGGATRPFVDDVLLASPAWSPDGRRIAVQARKHDHWDIVLMDAAGNTLAQLTGEGPGAARKSNNVAPTWSPDGRSILFLSDRDGTWRIYTMRADGSQQALFLPKILRSMVLRYEFAAERVVSWSE